MTNAGTGSGPHPQRPAFSRESTVLRLPGAVSLEDLSPAWAWGGSTGRGVRVAIVDSGVEADHPALEGCVDRDGGIALHVAADGSVVREPGPHDDVFGHGTACAGVIHSLAPEAHITSVRVLGPNLTGKAAAFLAGLEWAVEQRFDVINLSLGTSKRDWALAFHDVCDAGYFSGCMIVTAANNMFTTSYPSLYAAVTSVACNTTTDPWRFHYNPEPPTEFLARGIDVDLAWKGGGRLVGTGNSYAAPHITGLTALIRSKHPQLRPFQVKTVLWATAANVRESPPIAGRLSRVATRARSTRLTASRLSAIAPQVSARRASTLD
ncbi:MAG TPA: S8 family serine peptidase [Acidimicrobiales bacterium]|nr:S8 family serine peptidase [Acidimicrobiales bacterium]